MDRYLTDEERVRRAENIVERRKNLNYSYNNGLDDNLNSEDKRIVFSKKRLFIQILVSIMIYSVFYYSNYTMSSNVRNCRDIVSTVLSQDVDFNSLGKSAIVILSQINQDKIKKFFNFNDEKNNEVDYVEVNENGGLVQDYINKTKFDNAELLSKIDKIVDTAEIDDITYLKNYFSFSWPVQDGFITSYYGQREGNEIVSSYHKGIDIGKSEGADIYCSMSGTVEEVSNSGDYGKHLLISNNDVSTLYAHCSELLVNEGEEVEQGKLIAKVGSTGKATGPHLHFEIRRNGNTIDPCLIF